MLKAWDPYFIFGLTILSRTQKKSSFTSFYPNMSQNPNNTPGLPVAKKPRLIRRYICPNPNCLKSFNTEKQWKLHISHSKECFQNVYKVLEVKQLATNQQLKSSQPHVGPRTRPVQQEDAPSCFMVLELRNTRKKSHFNASLGTT